jgi:hypothetical protein
MENRWIKLVPTTLFSATCCTVVRANSSIAGHTSSLVLLKVAAFDCGLVTVVCAGQESD